MRGLKAVFVGVACSIAVIATAAPASAAEIKVQNGFGDFTRYDNVANTLRVCDNSVGNGTAKGYLVVIGGNIWDLTDGNGNQDPCANAGPLSVDNTKTGYLWICENPSAPVCIRSGDFPL